jgi:dihydrofolate reductase/thymidylate synthase
MLIDIIVACCKNQQDRFIGIGAGNNIPWHSSEDLQHFKNITKDSAIIMGRKTHESIGRSLSDRHNIVIGNQFRKKTPGCFYVRSPEDAIELASSLNQTQVFIIGGSQIYNYFLHYYQVSKIYLTEINQTHQTDRSFVVPANYIEASYTILSNIATLKVYHCSNSAENSYLNIIKDIISNGVSKDDRTGVGTLANFGEKMTFDLQHGFPLLTTKRVPWKMVLKELLWFISGSTDNKILQEQNVHIWDGNTTREFLDNRGLSRLPEGDLGAMYGHAFRYYGSEYKDCKTDYNGQGYDQIANAVELIKNDPGSRRILITSYNPAERNNICLYPCHGLVIQFFVRNQFLDCQMYQRSADMGLGVPFNIASYAFLLTMMAHVTGKSPGKLAIITGDTHVYKNHIEPLQRQLNRVPYAFPELKINRTVDSIFDFKLEDFEMNDYRCYPGIKMKMAV